MSPYFSGILLSYAAAVLGLMSPGPNILAVIGTSMGVNRKAGISLALGVSAGALLWGLLTGAGLTALLTAYAPAITVIKVVGGIYLLWLAFKAFRAAASGKGIQVVSLSATQRPIRYFLRGLTVQMTNPKAALTWIAIMSLGLQGGAPWWVGVTIVLGIAVLSLIGHLLYALAFSTQRMVTVYRRAQRWIEAALGAFFSFAGIKLLTSEI
jgi:amino acid exporter